MARLRIREDIDWTGAAQPVVPPVIGRRDGFVDHVRNVVAARSRRGRGPRMTAPPRYDAAVDERAEGDHVSAGIDGQPWHRPTGRVQPAWSSGDPPEADGDRVTVARVDVRHDPGGPAAVLDPASRLP